MKKVICAVALAVALLVGATALPASAAGNFPGHEGAVCTFAKPQGYALVGVNWWTQNTSSHDILEYVACEYWPQVSPNYGKLCLLVWESQLLNPGQTGNSGLVAKSNPNVWFCPGVTV